MEPTPNAQSDNASRNTSVYLVWAIFAVWITFSLSLFIAIAQMGFTPRFVVSVIGTIGFFWLYLRSAWRIAQHLVSDTPGDISANAAWGQVGALILVSLIMVMIGGPEFGGFFIYTTAIAASSLPYRQGIGIIAALALVAVLGPLAQGADSRVVLGNIFTVLVTGFTTLGMKWAFATNRALRQARRELAQMAVNEERLRFARDLHDLLGHTLSLIALKSELAGRLVTLAPERAANEIGDIEAAARTALQEVREAVAGYRQPTLAGELHAAHEMLEAAGIGYTFTETGMATPLRPAIEGALAWGAREGVTNVIRHSHARRCTLQIAYSAGAVSLTVQDDGRGHEPDVTGSPGNGLSGLRERAAALGGTCSAEPQPNGGFRLTVTLPVVATPQTALAPQIAEEAQ